MARSSRVAALEAALDTVDLHHACELLLAADPHRGGRVVEGLVAMARARGGSAGLAPAKRFSLDALDADAAIEVCDLYRSCQILITTSPEDSVLLAHMIAEMAEHAMASFAMQNRFAATTAKNAAARLLRHVS
jgi:hypothetical protein